MKMVLASRNKKKCGEIAALLQPYQFELLPVSDFSNVPDVVENGDTFEANAILKATEVATATGCWAIGEDSGLQVDVLEGAPGIYSARYSGEHATDKRNNKKLIANLQDVPPEKRGAGYCCSIAVADATAKIILTVEATCRGRITTEPRGTNGFGYDPYFLIPEYHQTFGELTPLVKQHLSHRSRAFRKLIPLLLNKVMLLNKVT